MELMNESTIKSAVPKIIETPNHFIMNTQIYIFCNKKWKQLNRM